MSQAPKLDELSPLKRAIVELRELRGRLDAMERARSEPIAIVGVGCRFPGGAIGPESYWTLLREGRDAVTEVPGERWDVERYYDADPEAVDRGYARHGSFLPGIDQFDPGFFGIAPREAVSMDPQQRLLLEVAWEALENAGQSPQALADSDTGVFIGLSTSDYASLASGPLDPYIGTGVSASAAAGRLSYLLGLRGPSLAVDTACSSSLVATHLACQSLRNGECRIALAGGVNLVLNPLVNVVFSKARMLSASGRCHTFAAGADGYVRGEGCGVVVLKRLSHALADRDHVLAVIRGSAVNQDGRSGGLTVPNGTAQEALLRQALASAGVEARDVGYVEAHGTGTALGDPIEMRALASALEADARRAVPLVVGSVKTNFGHLEAAAGMAGLIKAALSVSHGEIPRHLHFDAPSPHIDWTGMAVSVPRETTPWPAALERRIAGVSAFGFTGTNAHVIVEAAPPPAEAASGPERPRHVLTLSARSAAGLDDLAARVAAHLATSDERLADIAFTANTGRAHFPQRLALVAADTAEAQASLAAFGAKRPAPGLVTGRYDGPARPLVAFLFTGQGSQYPGMGRVLDETQPAFRRALDRCDEIAAPLLGRPLRSLLHPSESDLRLVDSTTFTQPALFALEFALAEMWRSWGVVPDAVLGHSLGEYVAACVAGVFGLEDALRLVIARGRLMQGLPVAGEMAAVFAGEERVREVLARGLSVDIAAVNGPDSVVLSGAPEPMAAALRALGEDGVRHERLVVSHAFHSRLMDPMLEAFEREAAGIRFAAPRIDVVSNVSGALAGPEIATAAYWRRHVRQPVRFGAGVAALRELGMRVFVEIGPRPTLLSLAKRGLPSEGTALVPSLRAKRDDWSQVLESLATLHVHGVAVDWDGFDKDYPRSRVSLPTSPFFRERFWFEAKAAPQEAPQDAGSLYEIAWKDAPPEAPRDAARPGCRLLVGELPGLEADLRVAAEADLEAACRDGFARTAGESLEVVYVAGLAAVPGSDEPASSYIEALAPGCRGLLRLVQALAATQAGRPARLWVVTRGSQPAGDGPLAPHQAPLWGLARSVASEHPELRCVSVDLDPRAPADEAAGLAAEMRLGSLEDRVALRGGARRVARLVRSRAALDAAPSLRADATYLVTGGLGALGLQVAEALVARGARALVLLGRRAPGERATQAIAALRANGVHVDVAACDVTQERAVGQVLDGIPGERPLRGIVHAAGVVDDAAAAVQEWDRFAAVLAPKVAGAVCLDRLTRDAALDFFVLFSSSAAILGTPGQGSYAAANAFLDSFAHARRASGRPGLSLDWGPWSGLGMAAGVDARGRERWRASGFDTIEPSEGLATLTGLLQTSHAQVAVLPIRWDTLLAALPAGPVPPLFAEWSRRPAPTPAPAASAEGAAAAALRQRLAAAAHGERAELLAAYLTPAAARVLGTPADRVVATLALAELGLDSLMAVQLKNQVERDLGVELPLRDYIEGPSVARLAELLAGAARPRETAEPLLPRARSGDAPLSFAQQRLWFLDQMQPGPAYNLAAAIRLDGPLDVAALQAALDAIVARHEALRTTFPARGGAPVQLIAPELRVPLEVVAVHDMAEAAVVGLATRKSREPFDLARGPLLRVTLFELGPQAHVVLLGMHHIVSDGWSMRVLARELTSLYAGLREGRPKALPALPVQYADFAAWERRHLGEGRLEAPLAFWRRALAEPLPATELPLDHPRRETRTFEAGIHHETLPAELRGRVAELAVRLNATPFMVLLAAFQALLYRHTGEPDVLVGTPVASRNRSEIEGLIGFFVNVLVLRSDLSGRPSFAAAVGRAREATLEAYAHQDVPFEKLVQELRPERDLRRNPFFQVAFALQNAAGEAPALPGLELRALELDASTTRFDLEAEVWDEPAGLRLRWVFNRDLFDAPTIARLAGRYRSLLTAALERPTQPLDELPLLDAAEARAVVDATAATARPYPAERALGSLFTEQAQRTPAAVAVTYGTASLTYAELEERSNRLAHRLRALGVRLDAGVGLCVERSVEMVVGMLGIVKAGGAYVPLDPSYPAERLSFMIEDSGLKLVLTHEALAPAAVASLCFDRDREAIAAESAEPIESGATGQNLAYVIYTSGSTGTPKGVAVTHQAVSRLVLGTDYVQLTPEDRVAQASNASFDAATFEIWGALLNGARLVGIGREVALAPRELSRTLQEHGITTLFQTTALFNQVATEAVTGFSGLKHLLFGGEAVDPERVRRALEVGRPQRLLHVYGPTEVTTFATWQLVESVESGASTVPIGRPLANTTAYVLDQGMNPVPAGVPGELYLGGPGLARGYLNQPALTAERFVPSPFGPDGARLYKTGDLVRRQDDGAIVFLGRRDHQVKLRGFRIELGEIEAALLRDPAVKDAVVLVREDVPGDQRLVAYVAAAGERPDVTTLRARLKTTLPDYLMPSSFVILEALPLNPNGKLDRKALPAPQERSGSQAAFVAPGGGLEAAIAAVWREVLQLDHVGVEDNFFDLGGHSLLLVPMASRLREALSAEIAIVDLFQYPTIASLARHLDGAREVAAAPAPTAPAGSRDIAVIAMSGRFPGSRSVDELWQNLLAGREAIRDVSDDELRASGLDPEALGPGYVKRGAILEDADLFDAGFFRYTAREATLMDPQQRVFLETAWHALETAGYDPARYAGRVGVFAGIGMNAYGYLVAQREGAASGMAALQAAFGSAGDFLATRVSYRLNLRGPSLNVQTACSTSLVAVHLACQSLLAGECDMALAGGASIRVPQVAGYAFEDGSILSPDGACRAFDAKAQGTVIGSGAGVVVLKRLEQAQADGDTIEGVIKGSAVNNDGSDKVGYTAPSVSGQADVIAAAQAAAGIAPRRIGYVEAHGTGTTLGDPVEVAALTRAFRAGTDERSFCAIGSLKTNLGHLDAAAGVAGLMKALLVVKHGVVPPSLHFESPNPQIDFAASPFHVASARSAWREPGPRFAGVSSFGIGGTNAHAVIGEAPPAAPPSPSRPSQLLVVSAKTPSALDAASRQLAAALDAHPERSLADVAYTLAVGRAELPQRRFVVAADAAGAARALAQAPARAASATRPVAFLFPGQGAQYAGMTTGLYRDEPVFRRELDRCDEVLRPLLGADLQALLSAPDAASLDETRLAQPVLFAVEYALARLFVSWGVVPSAMLGHSLGEYVAACLAGVFGLEDALGLVVARGRLMQALPRGAMLSVPIGAADLAPRLGEGLGLAAANAPGMSVVAGTPPAIDALENELRGSGVESRRLATSHAFHSPMMEPILEPFRAEVAQLRLSAPALPYLSTLTGTWIRPEEATDPGYWTRHLRETVRFGDALGELLREPQRLLVEVGPGQALGRLARRHPAWGPDHAAVAALGAGREAAGSEDERVLAALGAAWAAGARVDFPGVFAAERRGRVPLPVYPFERQRYWIEAPEAKAEAPKPATAAKASDVESWFYAPTWTRSALPASKPAAEAQRWLVFLDDSGLGARLVKRLEAEGRTVATVRAGLVFAALGERAWAVDPGRADNYDLLVAALREKTCVPERVAHLWGFVDASAPAHFEPAQDRGFYSLLSLARAFDKALPGQALAIDAVTSGVQHVTGGEELVPERATVLGACRGIPQEHPAIRCRAIDIDAPGTGIRLDVQAASLQAELESKAPETVVALRRGLRWTQAFEPLRLPPSEPGAGLREGGVYLITGGLGGVGLEIASRLAARRARLVLTHRRPLPPPAEWAAWRRDHEPQDPTRQRIERLQALEAQGAELLLLAADVASEPDMRRALRRAREQFGALHGVVHAAGAEKSGRAIAELDRAHADEQFRSRVQGLQVLQKVLAGQPLDFCLVWSSLGSVLGVRGFVAYAAAHQYMDAFVVREQVVRPDPPWLVVNADNWATGSAPAGASPFFMSADEGGRVFERLIAAGLPQVVVSTGDLDARRARWIEPKAEAEPEAAAIASTGHARGELSTPFVAPRDARERALAGLWQELLGIDRVGVDDNFFELGGDSVLSIQVASRAAALGLRVRSHQVLEQPTIAALAALGEEAKVVAEPEPAAAGPVPVTPIQAWFFEQPLMARGHFNQAAVFEVKAGLGAATVRDALAAVVARHDALRLRYRKGAEGWQGALEETPVDEAWSTGDIAGLAETARTAVVEREASLLQARIDLRSGPLWRALFLDAGGSQPGRLVLVIHHLLIDAVAWRVLAADLESACRSLAAGQPAALPPATGFAAWARLQQRAVAAGAAGDEAAYWLGRPWAGVRALPVDHRRGENDFGSVREVAAALTSDETRALLQDAAAAHQAQASDLLLGALAVALRPWSKASALLADLEGHGRETGPGEPDVARTVGWFTTLFPFVVPLEASADAGAAVAAAKAERLALPGHGRAFGQLRYLGPDPALRARLAALPRPELNVLYLGRMDAAAGDGSLRATAEATGPSRHAADRRAYLLEVTAQVRDGALGVVFAYSENRHRSETIEGLARSFVGALRELLAGPAAAYPGARLDSKDIAKVLASVKRPGGKAPR